MIIFWLKLIINKVLGSASFNNKRVNINFDHSANNKFVIYYIIIVYNRLCWFIDNIHSIQIDSLMEISFNYLILVYAGQS